MSGFLCLELRPKRLSTWLWWHCRNPGKVFAIALLPILPNFFCLLQNDLILRFYFSTICLNIGQGSVNLLICKVEHTANKLRWILSSHVIHHIVEGDARSCDRESTFCTDDAWLSIGCRSHTQNLLDIASIVPRERSKEANENPPLIARRCYVLRWRSRSVAPIALS